MSKFKVGDRVGFIDVFCPSYELDDFTYFGEVDDISHKGKVTVKWDGVVGFNEFFSRSFSEEELMPEKEAKKTAEKIISDYDKVEKKVSTLMSKAADNLNAARKIAEDNGYDFNDMYDAYADFYTAMHNVGWNTSSLSC